MDRFRRFIDREMYLDNVKNTELLQSHGVECTYFSDPPEDFDELEFRTSLTGQNDIVITVTVEKGKVKRILFNKAKEEDPDDTRSLTGNEMEELLTKKGEELVSFFDTLTR